MIDIYIRSVIGLAVLWFIWYYGIRLVLLARFRQKLFGIRDRLFDYAAEGNIEFSDPAYGSLRSMMNSLIRFAHKVTFCIAFLLHMTHGDVEYAEKEIKAALEPIRRLPTEKATVLLKLHAEILMAMLVYVLQRSPVLWIYLAVFIVRLLIRGAFRKLSALSCAALLPAFGFQVPGIVL